MFLHFVSYQSNLKAFPEFSSQSGFHNTCFHGLFLRHWKIVPEKEILNKVMLHVRFPATTRTKQSRRDSKQKT